MAMALTGCWLRSLLLCDGCHVSPPPHTPINYEMASCLYGATGIKGRVRQRQDHTNSKVGITRATARTWALSLRRSRRGLLSWGPNLTLEDP